MSRSGCVGPRARLRRLAALAGALMASLALAGCSGQLWRESVDTESGRDVTFDERIFRDIEHVLRVCASPMTLEAGLERVDGQALLLPSCHNRVTDAIDFDRVLTGAPDAARARAVVNVMRIVNQPLPEPIPARIQTQDDETSIQPLLVLIPVMDAQIEQWEHVPDIVKEQAKQLVRSAAQAGCTHRQGATVDLVALRVSNVRMSWERVRGRRVLRVVGRLDDGRPQARARIINRVDCFGSTDNLLTDLVQGLVPERDLDVTLVGGRLRADFALSPKLDSETRRGRVAATLSDLDVVVDGLVIQRFGAQPADLLLDDAIRKLELAPAALGARARAALRQPLAPLGAALAATLQRSLGLDQPDDSRGLSLAGVEVDTSAGAGTHTMRFSAMRTDQVCRFMPGGRIVDGRFVPGEGRMVCSAWPAPARPEPPQQCVKLPNGRIVCFPIP